MTAPFSTSPTVIVTGVASLQNIGRATATQLVSHSWNISVLDLDPAACTDLATKLHDRFSIAAHGIRADIVDSAAVRPAIDKLEVSLPPFIALVNIAGVSSPARRLTSKSTPSNGATCLASTSTASTMSHQKQGWMHCQPLVGLGTVEWQHFQQDPVFSSKGQRHQSHALPCEGAGRVWHHDERHLARPD